RNCGRGRGRLGRARRAGEPRADDRGRSGQRAGGGRGGGGQPVTARTVAAVDLGAESGRVTAVSFDGARLDVRVVNRFGHEPGVRAGLLRWDIDGLWASIRSGLAELSRGAQPVSAVGVDTWGVDYGLYGADGALVDEPVSYRDPRN